MLRKIYLGHLLEENIKERKYIQKEKNINSGNLV